MKTALSTTHLIAAAVIAGAFGIGFFSGPAFADQPGKQSAQFEFRFAYSPSELTAAPQASKLLNRLEHAVRRECGGNRKMSINERKTVDECIDRTMKASVPRFGSEAVAQAYKSRAAG